MIGAAGFPSASLAGGLAVHRFLGHLPQCGFSEARELDGAGNLGLLNDMWKYNIIVTGNKRMDLDGSNELQRRPE